MAVRLRRCILLCPATLLPATDCWARYTTLLSAYARATPCPVLNDRTVLFAYARAPPCPVLSYCMVPSASVVATRCAILN
eukprot:1738488-Rhodomonas_salina.1